MVRVTVSETYDLSTKLNKMSLIGVHTPGIELVKKTYGGILANSKMIRFHHADVRLACASVLPADPQQIGVEAGDIAPQDMFNPILYKAVSNQAMNEFELRMHGIEDGGDEAVYGNFHGQSIDKSDAVTHDADEFAVYYSLLANRKGWKVAHPQRGLLMNNLRPYVYEKLYNVGDSPSATDGTPEVLRDIEHSTAGLVAANAPVKSVRGRSRPMPALPTSTMLLANVHADKTAPYNVGDLDQLPDGKDLHVYCGLIVMPPAKLNRFYYRLVVRWHIDLIGIRPLSEIQSFPAQKLNATTFYGSDYFPITDSRDNRMAMVDVDNGEIEKIMEGI